MTTNRTITDGMRDWPAWLKALDPGPGDAAVRWSWFTRVRDLYQDTQPGDQVGEFVLRAEAERAAKPNPLGGRP